MFSKTHSPDITRPYNFLISQNTMKIYSTEKGQDTTFSTLIYTLVNIYLNSWIRFPVNNRQPSKALKLNRQPSKLEKFYTVNRQSYQPIETLFKQWQGLLTGACIHPIAFFKKILDILRNVSNLWLIGTSNTLTCSRCSDNKVRKREKIQGRETGERRVHSLLNLPHTHPSLFFLLRLRRDGPLEKLCGWGGGGAGQVSSRMNFFVNISLKWIFSGKCMNIFLG